MTPTMRKITSNDVSALSWAAFAAPAFRTPRISALLRPATLAIQTSRDIATELPALKKSIRTFMRAGCARRWERDRSRGCARPAVLSHHQDEQRDDGRDE